MFDSVNPSKLATGCCSKNAAASAARNVRRLRRRLGLGQLTKEQRPQARGLWIPVVFGWMTHVYPNAKSPNDVWAGMDMHMDANTGAEEMKK